MKTKAFLSFDGDRIHQVWSSCARRLCGSFLAAIVFSSSPAKAARSPEADSVVSLGGLTQAAQVTRDVNGIAHLRAGNTHDLYFLQGYVHAQDRLFQMDVLRRLGDRKSTRLNSSHITISYAVFCLKKKKTKPKPNNAVESRTLC